MLGFRQMLQNFIVVVSNTFFILVSIGVVDKGAMKRKKEGHVGH